MMVVVKTGSGGLNFDTSLGGAEVAFQDSETGGGEMKHARPFRGSSVGFGMAPPG